MIDTHCHIDDPQYADGLSAFLDDQKAGGVEAMYVPGVDASSINSCCVVGIYKVLHIPPILKVV